MTRRRDRWAVVGYLFYKTPEAYRFEIATYSRRFWATLHAWWLDIGHFHRVVVEEIN